MDDSYELYEPAVPPGAEFIRGDIRCLPDVEVALHGADVVYHIASYGMSGAEAVEHDTIYQVNVSD